MQYIIPCNLFIVTSLVAYARVFYDYLILRNKEKEKLLFTRMWALTVRTFACLEAAEMGVYWITYEVTKLERLKSKGIRKRLNLRIVLGIIF